MGQCYKTFDHGDLLQFHQNIGKALKMLFIKKLKYYIK